MPGVRLHHPTFTSLTYVVETPQAIPRPRLCNSCGKVHERKAIHLRLDPQGDVIVSRAVYAKLQTVGLAGMQLSNEVKAPPPLIVGAVDQPGYKTIEAPLAGNGQEFYQPGHTKYEARDRQLAPFLPLIEATMEKEDRIATAKRKEKRLIVPLGLRRK